MLITDWRTWLATITDHPPHVISEKIGKSPSTVGRWMRNDSIPAGGAIEIARAYNADPVASLVASGWIKLDDIANGGVRNAITLAPTSCLLDELRRRGCVDKRDG